MAFSFWESEHYNHENAVIIIGCGITGLSTAISLKEKDRSREIVVVDKAFPPQGASTKNAGFVCFGSPSEILDDLQCMSEEECIEIISMRWHGARMLSQRLAESSYCIENVGGFELYAVTQKIDSSDLDRLNRIMQNGTGIQNYFQWSEQAHFPNMNSRCISMSHEGQLNAMTMMSTLFRLAHDAGVKFYFGEEVESIDVKHKVIHLSGENKLKFEKLAITTNGFTNNLMSGVDVHPARNQVLMTSEIKNLKWNGVYHYNKGYYYFRRYGDRILLGGARNFDPENELTQEFGNTSIIQNELIHFLENTILGHRDYQIDHWWSGILGIGHSKYPIVREVHPDVFLGVRLGGMGVAIGSLLGKNLADKILAH